MFTINLKFRELAVAVIQVFSTKVAELFSTVIGGLVLLVVSVGRPIFGVKFKMLAIAVGQVFFEKVVELIEMAIGVVALLIIFSVGRPIFWLVDKRKERLQSVGTSCV